MQFPISADELVDMLDKHVPERLPEPGETLEAIQRYAGKRELVLLLKNLREKRAREGERRTKRGSR